VVSAFARLPPSLRFRLHLISARQVGAASWREKCVVLGWIESVSIQKYNDEGSRTFDKDLATCFSPSPPSDGGEGVVAAVPHWVHP
jgi:hypothetical protein